jgi:NTE family protein
MRRKFDEAAFQINKSVGIKDGKVQVPAGLIRGQKLELELKKLLLPVAEINDFSQLPIPFRAVASDIVSSETVVLSGGSLAQALRASMSVPGAFTPVELNGRLLVDGGINNNMPVDVVRDMGADIVIAVDVSSPLLKQDDLGSMFDIVTQLTNIMVYRNTEIQIRQLTDQDLLITPELDGFSAGNFDQAASLIPLGEETTRKYADKLAVWSQPADESSGAIAQVDDQVSLPVISFIRVDNDSAVDDDYLREKLHQPLDEPLDLPMLEADIGRIYGLDTFDSVQYQLEQRDGQTGLVLIARRKAWGPNYLQFGLSLSSDLSNDNNLSLRFGLTRTPINRLNGEWRSILSLGVEPGIETELYQPMSVGSPWFAIPRAFLVNNRFNVSEDGNIIAETRVNRIGGSLALGREFGSTGDARTGYRRYYGDTEIAVGDPDLPDENVDGGELFFNARYDSLDDVFFPRRGWKGRFGLLGSRESLGADNDFDQATIDAITAATWGKHTLQFGARIETTFNGEAPIQNFFRLGGLFNLPGYTDNQIAAQNAVLLRTGYLRSINPVFSMPAYLGGTLQYGDVFEDKDEVSFSDLQFAAAVYIGLETFLGPVYAGYGVAESGKNSIYLRIGGLF